MGEGRFRSWSWAARRLGISAFLVVHVGATLLWVMPPCPARAAGFPVVRYYIFPLGLWQYWGMFAPDPIRETVTLEAEVVDSRGIRATFPFTRVADYSVLGAVPRFRHSKYAVNLAVPDVAVERRVAARYALRRLDVPDDAFPADVTLRYQVRNSPPPGTLPDPMTPARTHVLETLHFDNPGEVRR